MAYHAELARADGGVAVAQLHATEDLQRRLQVGGETGVVRLEAALRVGSSHGDAPASQVAQGLLIIFGALHPIVAESDAGDCLPVGGDVHLARQAGVAKVAFHDPVRATLG